MRYKLTAAMLVLAIAAPYVAGAELQKPDAEIKMTSIPNAATYTQAPLRNRIRVELKTSVSEVWALAGNLSRLPEYSAGLARVDIDKDTHGTFKDYVCHFKPMAEGGESITHRENIRWYEPNRGYASTAEEPNALGMTNTFALMTLETAGGGTFMTYAMYYDAVDLAGMKIANDQALVDIGEQLIARFGGRIVERISPQ